MDVSCPYLVEHKNILMPTLHIKLELMKSFVKKLDKEDKSFKYLTERFSQISSAKLKEGVFIEPPIRELMNNTISKTVSMYWKMKLVKLLKMLQNSFEGIFEVLTIHH